MINALKGNVYCLQTQTPNLLQNSPFLKLRTYASGSAVVGKTFFDAEYIYGFVRWGSASKVDDVTASRAVQDGVYALLWQRYDNNKMAAICYYVLHLQQYSHRLNLLYFFLNESFGILLSRFVVFSLMVSVSSNRFLFRAFSAWGKTRCHRDPCQGSGVVLNGRGSV